jgi:hypothetical protein
MVPKEPVSGEITRFELNVEDDSILGEAMIKWTKDLTSADRKNARSSRSGFRIVSIAPQSRGILRGHLSRHSLADPERSPAGVDNPSTGYVSKVSDSLPYHTIHVPQMLSPDQPYVPGKISLSF